MTRAPTRIVVASPPTSSSFRHRHTDRTAKGIWHPFFLFFFWFRGESCFALALGLCFVCLYCIGCACVRACAMYICMLLLLLLRPSFEGARNETATELLLVVGGCSLRSIHSHKPMSLHCWFLVLFLLHIIVNSVFWLESGGALFHNNSLTLNTTVIELCIV